MEPAIHLTAAEIAALVQGSVEGDAARQVARLASIEQPDAEALTFMADTRYAPLLYEGGFAVAIVDAKFTPERPLATTLVRVANPQLAFAQVMGRYFQREVPRPSGVEAQAFVSPQAQVAPDACIGAFCYVDAGAKIGAKVQLYPGVYIGRDVEVGAGSVLFPNVTVYHSCRIGANCRIHASTIIGADGFGFARTREANVKIPQVGNVVIEDEVEIGANCTIDRATIGSTVVRHGVKMDNMVHIAHNVVVGELSLLAAQAAIAGSAKLGKGCLLGGQSAVSPHVILPDFTQVSGQAAMSKTIKKSGRAFRGSPAREMSTQLKIEASQGYLPAMLKRIEQLEQLVQHLSQNGSAGTAAPAPSTD